jgi:Uma2 family endonuclease
MNPVLNFSDLDLTKQYTYSDYMLWQFQERVELIKGFINKMSPAPNRLHQTISLNVSSTVFHKFKHESCKVYVAPFDVRLPIKSKLKETTVVQPDLCIVCDEYKLDDQGCNGAPDLIVEIISPNNRKHDLETKFKLYEEAGVLEYWIIEPMQNMVLVYVLRDGVYIGLPPKIEGTIIESSIFPELKVAVDDVFFGV